MNDLDGEGQLHAVLVVDIEKAAGGHLEIAACGGPRNSGSGL